MPGKGWKTRIIKTPITFSMSAMEERMRWYRPSSSSAKGVCWPGLDFPKIIFNLSGGQWRWEFTYFATVDAKIKWPEDFSTGPRISCRLGHNGGRWTVERRFCFISSNVDLRKIHQVGRCRLTQCWTKSNLDGFSHWTLTLGGYSALVD